MISVIVLISAFLNLVWFRDLIPFGSGESGILFFNLDWHFQATAYAWKSSLLGNVVGITTASAPTYFVLSLLERIGAQTGFIQMLVSFIVFTTSGCGIYFLSKELFPRLTKRDLSVAVAFYWFNPFSLVNVWNRFTNNYILFFGLLPVATFLYVRGLKTLKPIYAFAIALLSIVFSFALTSLPFDLILWFVFVYTTIYYFISEKNRRRRVSYLKFFFLTLFLFIVVNLWWISQVFSLTSSGSLSETLSSFFTTAGNLSTLSVLSEKLGQIQNLLRFKHGSFFSESGLWWRQLYDLNGVKALEFVIPGIILYTIWKSRTKRTVLYLASLFFLGIFLSKGNALPFGELFEFGFSRSSSLQVFRNPFEKIGLLMILPAAPLLAYSFNYLRRLEVRSRFSSVGAFISVVVLALWSLPFFTSLVFTGAQGENPKALRSYKVKVPDYYFKADKYFKNKNDIFRFLLFPLGGEGITYNWDHQYSGIELSASIFETPNIGLNTTIPYFDRIVGSLERLLFTRKDFYKIAALLNARYIVVREDIDWKSRSMMDPKNVLNVLDTNTAYKKVEQFGQLSVYELNQFSYIPKIWAAKSAIKISPDVAPQDVFLSNSSMGDVLYSGISTIPNTQAELTKPQKIIYFSPSKRYDVEEAKAELLYAKHLPGSPLYIFSRFKENSERLSLVQPEAFFIHDLTHLGKRAMEIYLLKDNEAQRLQKSVDEYQSLLVQYQKQYPRNFESTPENFTWSMVVDEFSKHESLFTDAAEKSSGEKKQILTKLLETLDSWEKEVGVKTFYPHLLSNDLSQGAWVYRFKINKDEKLDLSLQNIQWSEYFKDIENNFLIQINDEVLELPANQLDDRISLGEVAFKEGVNEIRIAQPVPENLAKNTDVQIDSQGQSEATVKVNPFDPYAQYVISFDYWIKKGKNFDFSLIYDNDATVEGQLAPGFTQTKSTDGYLNDYRNETVYFHPRAGASEMSIQFKALPLNDCIEQRRPLSPSCENISFKRLFDKQTEVHITNIKLHKIFDGSPFLLNQKQTNTLKSPEVTFAKVSPAEYRVFVKGATDPYTLVFSETFNTGWTLKSDNQIPSQHILVNGFANGWTIDKQGDYEFTLYFKPQEILATTQQISLFTAICVVGGFLILLWKRKILI